MGEFVIPWDCLVEKREEKEEEIARREVGIPELSLLLENNNDHNECPMSSAISDYETTGFGHGKRLFHFLLHLLEKNRESNNEIIRWENRSEGLFRICSLVTLATLWGREKNNYSMDHNKLRRALRYYIEKGKLLKVDRHLYKFTTDFKESKFMKSNRCHQSSFEYPSKYRETINSEENSPLSIIDENTRSGDIFNPPPVLVDSESINFDACYNHHEILEAAVSTPYKPWFCDKTNGSSYEKMVNVNSTNNILYSSNIDIPVIENFNSPSTSDNCSSLSPNESPMSDTSEFSLKMKRSSSEICLSDLLPNKRYCPEASQTVTLGDSDFSNLQTTADPINDEWHEQYIVPDTSLHSYKDLSPDSSHFAAGRFDYGKENGSCDVDMSSNFQALLQDLHKELQYLNNA